MAEGKPPTWGMLKEGFLGCWRARQWGRLMTSAVRRMGMLVAGLTLMLLVYAWLFGWPEQNNLPRLLTPKVWWDEAFSSLGFLFLWGLCVTRPWFINLKDVLIVKNGLSWREAKEIMGQIKTLNHRVLPLAAFRMAVLVITGVFIPTLFMVFWPWVICFQVAFYRDVLENKQQLAKMEGVYGAKTNEV